MTVEELLRKDAALAMPAPDTKAAMGELSPHIAKAAHQAKLRASRRREAGMAAAACLPALALLAGAASAALLGDWSACLAQLAPLGALAVAALAALPVLEHIRASGKNGRMTT